MAMDCFTFLEGEELFNQLFGLDVGLCCGNPQFRVSKQASSTLNTVILLS
jgi:hypothetical protein